jgi:hypothetical protein
MLNQALLKRRETAAINAPLRFGGTCLFLLLEDGATMRLAFEAIHTE